MSIRPLAWSDFEEFVELYYSRFEEVKTNPELGVFTRERRPPWDEEALAFARFMRSTEEGSMVANVAIEEGKLVGTCTVERKGNHVEDRHIGVLGIIVLREWRGKGLGSQLMEATIQGCIGRFELLHLAVIEVNANAHALYQKFGFREHGRAPRAFHRGDRYFDEILMTRIL